MTVSMAGALQDVKYGNNGMRYEDHQGLSWMVNPLVVRHGCRITIALIAVSYAFYSLFETKPAADVCLPYLIN